MKKLGILIITLCAGYQGWNTLSPSLSQPEPLHETPYVVVYGRNSCGFTQQTIQDLKRAGIPFEYQIVDNKSVADLLHSRMENSGMDTRRYNLPVVDVSNHISIRPNIGSIVEAYEN